MKDDPILIRKLPPTLLIRNAVETWPHKPDAEAFVYNQLAPGAMIWVRTRRGIKQRQVRLVCKARGFSYRGNRGRRFVVAHDRKGWCHTYWLSDVIRVQPKIKELMP